MSVVLFEAPDRGLDQDSHPRLIKKRFAPQIDNLLIDRPGVLRFRGPLCEGTTWNPGSSIGLSAVWEFGDKLLISRIASSATRTRDYWTAPYVAGSGMTNFRDSDRTMKLIDLTAGTVTDVTVVNSFDVIGGRGVRHGAFVYGFGMTSTVGAQNNGSGWSEPQRSLIRWNGSTTCTTYLSTVSPTNAMDIVTHYNRLFVLGGNAPGASTLERSSLFWSDFLPTDGTALPAAASAWQDDVSGLVNRIVIGEDRGTDFGVALAHVGPNLLILKRRSLWMLYGTSPTNFVVKQVSNEVGCLDPRSVVEYEGGVFFMSERGFMFYDGSTIRNVSQDRVQTALVRAAQARVGPRGADGGFCRAWALGGGYIAVQVGSVDPVSLTAVLEGALYLYHVPRDTWIQVSSTALGGIVAGGRTVGHTYLLGDTKLVKANYFVDPDNTPSGSEYFDSLDNNATRSLIPAAWTTRTEIIESALTQSQLRRAVLDYEWGLTLATSGWAVNLVGHSIDQSGGSPADAAHTFVRPSPDPGGSPLGLRGSFEAFGETDEVHLAVAATYPSIVNPPVRYPDAEIHGAYVEYVASRRTRAS